MKNITIIIVIFVILVFTFFVLIFKGSNGKIGTDINQRICEGYDEVIKSDINGIVNKAFVDEENHNFKKVLIEDSGEIIIIIFLDFDRSGLFQYLSRGDSIIKPPNTNIVNVFKKEVQSKKFELDYGCVR